MPPLKIESEFPDYETLVRQVIAIYESMPDRVAIDISINGIRTTLTGIERSLAVVMSEVAGFKTSVAGMHTDIERLKLILGGGGVIVLVLALVLVFLVFSVAIR